MGKSDEWCYGVVLDAGSSGTRIHIYRWLKNEIARLDSSSLLALPAVETKDKWTKKVHPGVSTFGETPDLVGSEHLQGLLEHAFKYVPKHAVAETPIFLLATAGVRLLPDKQRKALLEKICSYIRSESDFYLPDCDLHIQVIPGETEGLYGWLAANYLLGGFDAPKNHNHGKGHHTYGFLDMGGASAQIAFAPNATEAEKHANDLKLLRLRVVNGQEQEYKVFVTTWLGFGVNEARKHYVDDLIESYAIDGLLEMPDPCLPSGLKMSLEGKIIDDIDVGKRQYLRGTGRFDECLRRTFPLLKKDVPCEDEPCLINGVHVPAIDFDVNHFIGISEYWHTTHEVFEMAYKDKSYDFNTYQSRVKDFCEQSWSTIQHGVADKTWGKKVDEKSALEVCFKASWLINMLHDGIGIPRVGIEKTSTEGLNGTKEVLESGKEKGYLDPFQAVDKIKSIEVSWTLGKILLYASADVPASRDDALPVGFGSNEPGIPADFQYPGGGGKLRTGLDADTIGSSDQSYGSIIKSDASHRLPGFIFFLLIVIVAIFYLFGRDRRSRFYSTIFGSSRIGSNNSNMKKNKPPGPIFSIFNKLRGRHSGTAYDRVLEEGNEPLYEPDDFELGDMDSDSDSLASKKPIDSSSGRGSPRRTFKPVRGSWSPELIDRTGLVVRTESRERLDSVANGRTKSRTGSPTRFKGMSTMS